MSPQRTIAYYRITAKRGRASMGEVHHKAAIKILPSRSPLTLGA